jgi:hypothetical protein
MLLKVNDMELNNLPRFMYMHLSMFKSCDLRTQNVIIYFL